VKFGQRRRPIQVCDAVFVCELELLLGAELELVIPHPLGGLVRVLVSDIGPPLLPISAMERYEQLEYVSWI